MLWTEIANSIAGDSLQENCTLSTHTKAVSKENIQTPWSLCEIHAFDHLSTNGRLTQCDIISALASFPVAVLAATLDSTQSIFCVESMIGPALHSHTANFTFHKVLLLLSPRKRQTPVTTHWKLFSLRLATSWMDTLYLFYPPPNTPTPFKSTFLHSYDPHYRTTSRSS